MINGRLIVELFMFLIQNVIILFRVEAKYRVRMVT